MKSHFVTYLSSQREFCRSVFFQKYQHFKPYSTKAFSGTINGKLIFSETTDKVAFTAFSDSGTVNSNTYVGFDHLLLNIGNGFDVETSVFTAPKSGNYEISCTLNSDSGYYGLQPQIRKNNNEVISFRNHYPQSNKYTSGGMKIILPLKQGETIQIISSYSIYSESKRYRVFSGKLL